MPRMLANVPESNKTIAQLAAQASWPSFARFHEREIGGSQNYFQSTSKTL